MNEERLTPDEAKDQAEAWLRAHLGPRWRIARTRRQVKARLGLLSVSLRYSDDREDGWRCRLRDSIPRRTLKVQRDPHCPLCGEQPTVTELIDYDQFCGFPAREHTHEESEADVLMVV